MALVQCPECANQVSDQATACPKCGYPLAVTQKPVNPMTVKTTPPAQTSSFWRCPSCSKHVPTRQTSCLCGFIRQEQAAVPVASPRPAVIIMPPLAVAEDRESTAWKAVLTLFLGGTVLAGAFYVSMNSGGKAELKESKVAAGAGEQPAAPRGPDVYGLPLLGSSPSTQQTGMQPKPSAPIQEPRPQATIIQVGPSEEQFRQEQERQERRQEVQLQRQQEMENRQRQDQWRTEATAVLAELRRTLGAYKYQLCAEVRGGITLSTPRDTRGEYSAAIAAARGFEESARAAGAREWVRIEWSEFPPPEERRSEPRIDSALLRKWNCPM